MSAGALTASQLHEPILPLARPPQLLLRPDQTVGEAHAMIRSRADAGSTRYLYVVSAEGKLAGVLPGRRLLAAAPDQAVSEVMIENVVAIPDWATVLIASEYFATRRLAAFPVVNGSGELVGVVDATLFTADVIELAKRTYDDIFQLIGVHGTEQGGPWMAFRDRFPWLLCNIAGGLIAAFIASQFERLLQEVIVLSLFIPIVLALGESVSMQALTLTLQNLTDGPIVWQRLFAGLWKEFKTAALLGMGCAAVVGLVVVMWRGQALVAGSIFVAIAASMIIACLMGVAIPSGLRVLKADPRIAAGPVVLASADVVTLVLYFGLGARLLGR